MSRFDLSKLELLMSYKVSAREVERLVDKLGIEPSDNLEAPTTESIHVAALQMVPKRYENLADYIIDMNLYIADAVNRRAQLVVMPAWAGLLPMTIAPNLSFQLPLLLRPQEEFDEYGDPLESEPQVDPEALYDLLTYCSDYTFDAYFHTMSALAGRHRICLMAGTSLYFDDNELCHRALLFGPDSELVGIQDKISLTPFERELQLSGASEIKLFETPVGPLSVLIGSDANYYEPARIAKNLGARLLLCPTHHVGEYTPIDSTLGLNLRVQETKLYGVQSSLVGDTGLGILLEGGGRIYAPNELLTHKNGVAAKSSGAFEPDLAAMNLYFDKIEGIESPYLYDQNPDFLDKYIDRLY